MSKVFTPEKVRELVNALQSNANLDCYEKETYYEVIDRWLEQNPIEPVVVGLSDEQVELLGNVIQKCYGTTWTGYPMSIIATWLKTQTFMQPNNFPQFDAKCKEVAVLTKELEQLKSQQVTPDWSAAPEWATSALLSMRYSNQNSSTSVTVANFKRPKPTPTVEVGQVWNSEPESSEFEVEIICFGKRYSEDTVCYKYTETQAMYVTTLSDFLIKFERVL